MVSNTKKEKSSKQHKHRSDHDRVEKIRERERRSPLDDDRSQSPTPTKSNANEASDGQREGTERASLSIEETNKLRASLGLKPLAVNDNSTADPDAPKKGLNSDENFVHRPPENLTEKKRTEELTRKLTERKEARTLGGKFLGTPTIASESAESATSWVDKMRQMEEEKRKAAERAKLLEKMDEEFGVGNLIHEESDRRKQKRYAPKDLTGLRIEHSVEEFKEGQAVILTLKDRKILRDEKDDDDEDEDVLINVNIIDNEAAKQRVDSTKKKTHRYRAYDDDDENADQFGMFNPNNVLDQYDEKKKSSFRLESGGIYDMSDEKVLDNMKQEIRTKMQSLAVPTPKVASEFYTADELEQFKKPKKVTKKKIRSRKMLKADDLLAMDSSDPRDSSSTTTSVFLRPAENRRPTAIASASKERPTTASLDKIKRELITTTATEDDDLLGPDDDLSNVPIEDDAFDELQAVVNKTMKLKAKKDHISNERVLSELIEERDRKLKVEIKSEPMETGIILPPGPVPPDDKNLVLDTMSEFCRNVGENTITSTSTVPKLRASTKLKRANVQSSKKSTSKSDVALDPDDELLQHALENEDLDDDAMDDTPAENVNTKPFRLEDSILSNEPTLDRGLASALQLALQKGYIEQEKNRQNARFVSDISAKHFTVEEKNSYEIEDKHARRDRYTSGPLTDFKEKEHYRPDVKLEYVDDGGRRMNEKEAFRFLSHRFHGKGSGKKKTEKRAKKHVEEELMKKMSSVDTPLQTCNLLKQKQVQLQQPYIVLSANRSKDSQLPPGSITKN
jgi:U4/U6.U5 tri-snRNP-associated protein 1